MASIYKPTIIRYVDESGKRTKKGTPGASKARVRSKVWRGKYRDQDGLLHDVKLCTDKTAAQAMLHRHIVKAARRHAGISDPHEEQRGRSLAEHIQDFGEYLESKGGTTEHVDLTLARIRAIADGCEFTMLRDFSAERVLQWLAELRRTGGSPSAAVAVTGIARSYQEIANHFGVSVATVTYWRQRGAPIVPRKANDLEAISTWRSTRTSETTGASSTTSNHYLRAMKSFGAWLVRAHRNDANPFSDLSALNVETDLRRPRRSLPAQEFEALIAAAKSSRRVFRGLDGLDRAMLYILAANTGLRASELASLRLKSLDFDAPAVHVQAAYSKRRRAERQPLRPDVAGMLKRWVAQREIRKPDETLWPGTWSQNAAEMLRGDLDDAQIAFVDDSGQFFDFHALRHQFISNLAKAGVHPKVAQELARHSTIQLTMDRYTHVDREQLNNALENLPGIGFGGKLDDSGDEGEPDLVASMVASVGGVPCPEMALPDADRDMPNDRVESQQPLTTKEFDADCQGLSPPDIKWGRWDSNPEPTDYESAALTIELQPRNALF